MHAPVYCSPTGWVLILPVVKAWVTSPGKRKGFSVAAMLSEARYLGRWFPGMNRQQTLVLAVVDRNSAREGWKANGGSPISRSFGN